MAYQRCQQIGAEKSAGFRFFDNNLSDAGAAYVFDIAFTSNRSAIRTIQRKISKQKRKLRRAKKKRASRKKVRKIKKTIRKLKKRLRRL